MNWHRMFGLVMTDFFTGSPYKVELELDLSKQKQFLDVVVIRKEPGTFQGRLPDGLENMADHNLISFKSHQESFDAWAMKELIGHYVNYRNLAYSIASGERMPCDWWSCAICLRIISRRE